MPEPNAAHRGPSKGWTKEARLVLILERFEQGVAGVRGSAVADAEGLPIANGFREPFDLMAVTAVATLTAKSSQTVFDHLRFKPPRDVIIEGEDAKVVVHRLGDGRASFIALVGPETNIGLLKLEMGAAARHLEEELGFTAPAGTRVEEVFLMAEGGLLIASAAPNPGQSSDRDIVAGMFSAVQSFVKDTFREQGGGALEEMDLAHLRVRILRGRWATLAVIASGPLGGRYVAAAGQALRAFEERNKKVLPKWDGDPESLAGTRELLDEALDAPTA